MKIIIKRIWNHGKECDYLSHIDCSPDKFRAIWRPQRFAMVFTCKQAAENVRRFDVAEASGGPGGFKFESVKLGD